MLGLSDISLRDNSVVGRKMRIEYIELAELANTDRLLQQSKAPLHSRMRQYVRDKAVLVLDRAKVTNSECTAEERVATELAMRTLGCNSWGQRDSDGLVWAILKFCY